MSKNQMESQAENFPCELDPWEFRNCSFFHFWPWNSKKEAILYYKLIPRQFS